MQKLENENSPRNLSELSKRRSTNILYQSLKLFIWKLPDSLNQCNNTYYTRIKMKPKDERINSYVKNINESNEGNSKLNEIIGW